MRTKLIKDAGINLANTVGIGQSISDFLGFRVSFLCI